MYLCIFFMDYLLGYGLWKLYSRLLFRPPPNILASSSNSETLPTPRPVMEEALVFPTPPVLPPSAP